MKAPPATVLQMKANSSLISRCVAETTAQRSYAPARKVRRSHARRWLATALLLASSLSAVALEPTTPLASFGRQSWVMENGLPQNTIQALAQTQDGFVWLGTELGLVRFDGNSFEMFDRSSKPALPGSDIRCLLQTRDGALWVGTSDGLARWKDGKTTAFTVENGLPGNVIRTIVQTADGVLWVWSDQGLARWSGERFIAINAEQDFLAGAITTAMADGQGGLRVETTQGTVAYMAGRWDRIPAQTGPPRDAIELVASRGQKQRGIASKTTVVVQGLGTQATRLTVGKELQGSRVQALLEDREGSVWIGTNSGLARWAEGKLQLLPITDSLATASVLALLEDREGNIWAGTEAGGLHILRDQRFRVLGARDGLSSDSTTAIVEDSAGTLWVGTSDDGLNAMRPGATGKDAVRTYSVRDGLLSDVILSLAAAP